MKVKRNRFLAKAVRQPQGRPLLAERLARHLQWAGALSARFRQRDGLPGWRSNTFIFGLRAKRWLLLLRRVLQFQVSRPQPGHTLTVTNNLLKRQISIVRERLPAPWQGTRSRVPVRRAAPLFALPQRFLARMGTLSPVEQNPERRLWLRTHAASAPLLFQPPAQRMTQIMGQNGAAADAGPLEITTRIMRQFRRVEERPFSREPGWAPGAPAPRGSEPVLEAPARKLRRDMDSTLDFGRVATVPPPAALNLTQLTDEVMRQLDRRLVAARERMGKI